MSDTPDKLKGRGRRDFFVNIFKLSETQDPDKIHEEWKCTGKVEYPEKDGDCICGSIHLKCAFRFYNSITGHVISTGSGCVKKLKLNTENKETNRFIVDFITTGWMNEFRKIKDIYTYSVEKRTEWMESILKDVTTDLYKKSLQEIQTLLAHLMEFHTILTRNGVTDHYVNAVIRMIQKREAEILFYREKKAIERVLIYEQKKEADRMFREANDKKRKEEAKEREENGGFTLLEVKEREEAERTREAKEREENGGFTLQEAKEKEEAERRKEDEQKREVERRRKQAYDTAFEEKAKAEATAKCKCGTLVKQICKCKIPEFTQRTLFGHILCSQCKGKQCTCN